MKLTHFLTTALPALAVALLLQPAPARATLPYNNGDLILGFRTTGASNADGLNSPTGTDYEIDLGSTSAFINATGTITFSSLNVGADLVAIFGASWNSRADLFWSLSGVVQPAALGLPNNTLFATKPEVTPGVQSTPWARLSAFASGAPANKLVSLAGAAFGYGAGSSGTLNQLESVNTIGGLIQDAHGQQAYATFQPGGANTTGATAFGVFAGGIEGNFSSGTAGSVLDLYELQPGSGNGAFLGAVQISNTGTVAFTPEPSSLAILAAGAGLLGMVRRRRS